MPTILVTGGCGFIGSNFIRHLLADRSRPLRIVNFDCLTYAGNLANLADIADHPALSVREGRHHRPRSGAGGPAAGRHRRHQLRGRKPRRSQHPGLAGRSSGPTCSARRCCSTPPASSASRSTCRSRPTRSTAASAPTGFFTEETPLHPNSPYSASKAGGGPARAGVSAHLRAAGGHHPLLEQLRPVPVPGEADSALRHEPDARRTGAGLRRRPAGPRLDSRPRPLPRRGGRVAEGEVGRGLQLRRPLREGQHRPDHSCCCELLGKPRDADQVRQGPARPRPPLRHRLHQGRSANSAGSRKCHSRRDWPRPSPGIRRTRPGSPRSATRNT